MDDTARLDAMDVDIDTETAVLLPPPPKKQRRQQQRDRPLPFPSLVDGKIEEQTLNINAHVDTLREWCASFGLHVTGAKAMLQDRLEEFSSDRERWKTFEPKKRRSLRGPREGGIVKNKGKNSIAEEGSMPTQPTARLRPVKQSALRAAEVFTKREPQPLAHMPLPLPSQVPLQTNEERAHILEWVQLAQKLYPYKNKAERMKAAQERAERAERARVPLSSADNLANLQSIVEAGVISGIQASTSASMPFSLAGPSTYPFPGTAYYPSPSPHNAIYPSPSHFYASTASVPMVSAPLPGLIAPLSDTEPMRTLDLASGALIFSASDVREPPAVSFTADEIPLLNSMWDDTSSYWRDYSYLEIKGRHIPITYWKQIFSRTHGGPSSGHWQGLKNHYSNWKAIVTQYRQGTESDFWNKFSLDNGQRMTYSKIVRLLRDLRAREDKELAAQARNEYGDKFSTVFSYQKGGLGVKPFTKDSEIARHYRKLKGLISQDDADSP